MHSGDDLNGLLPVKRAKGADDEQEEKRKRREKLAAWKSMMKIHASSFPDLINIGSNQKSETTLSQTHDSPVLDNVDNLSSQTDENAKQEKVSDAISSNANGAVLSSDGGFLSSGVEVDTKREVMNQSTFQNFETSTIASRPRFSIQKPRGLGGLKGSLNGMGFVFTDKEEKPDPSPQLIGSNGRIFQANSLESPAPSPVHEAKKTSEFNVCDDNGTSLPRQNASDACIRSDGVEIDSKSSAYFNGLDSNGTDDLGISKNDDDSFLDNAEDPFESYMTIIDAEVTELKRESVSKARLVSNTGPAAISGNSSDTSEDEDFDEEDDIQKLVKVRALKVLEPVDHSHIDYPPFRKCFYVEVPDLASMTPAEVSKMREQLDGIRIRGKNCPKPLRSFSQSSLPLKLLELLKKHHFDKPTPIQAQSLPAIMSGRDVIGIAKTGSGKTLAFVLPMIRHILDQPALAPGDGPIALIMAPTRELVTQIQSDVETLGWSLGVSSCAVYGGAGIGAQISDLKRGVHCIVATPGRIIELLCINNGRVTNLRRITYLVLDEADRMFDMGFEQQIFKIVQNIRPDRQTVMFSATFPRQVEAGARKILSSNPLEITVHGRSVVPETIEQIVEVRPTATKFRRLLEYIAKWITLGSILIFAERQESVDSLFQNVLMSGYHCMSFHSGKEQMDREEAIEAFKNGQVKTLIATSAAARGLDVPNLRLVVNYDVPNHHEDYVHRVGRTGRAGQRGTAVTFLDPESEEKYAGDLIKALQEAHQPVPEELQKIYQQFEEKHKAGLVKKHFWGFSGHGYKFTEEEERQHKAANMGLKRHFGADYVEDVSEGEENSEDEGKSIYAGVLSNISGSKSSRDTHQNEEDERKRAIDEKLREIELSKLQDNSIIKTTHYDTEIEINEFPKNVRWKILRKDAFADIVEFTGCAIAAKGVYVAPGKAPPPGERKLHLSIEGPTQEAVAMARAEIKKKLEDAMNNYLSKGGDKLNTGRYSVLE